MIFYTYKYVVYIVVFIHLIGFYWEDIQEFKRKKPLLSWNWHFDGRGWWRQQTHKKKFKIYFLFYVMCYGMCKLGSRGSNYCSRGPHLGWMAGLASLNRDLNNAKE